MRIEKSGAIIQPNTANVNAEWRPGLLFASNAAWRVALRAGISRSASSTFGALRTRGGGGNCGCGRRAGDDRRKGGQAGLELVAKVGRNVNRFLHTARVLLGGESDVDDVAIFGVFVRLELKRIFVATLE